MTMRADTFFSTADKQRITEAIQAVEATTSGEVAVMIVDQSDDYPEGQLAAGTMTGCLLAVIATDALWADSLWYFLPAALIMSLFCIWLTGRMPLLKRLATPSSRLEHHVRERALSAFYEQNLYQTKDATGVLFFISLFERKVWVLADKGIYEKISQETLQEYANDIAVGIKSGQTTETLCKEIAKAGDILARHFPIQPDDTNELSDELIVG